MAKVYAICPIIGDGQGENPFRSSASDLGVSVSNIIPSKPDGTPKYGFALCRIGTTNLAAVLELTNSYVFPDYPLDAELSGMESGVRTGMKQSVEAYDMDGEGLHLAVDLSDLTISYRSLLVSIYQQFDPLLSVASFNNFDVLEAVPE